MGRAKSQKEIDLVRQLYVQFGKDGQLSSEQVQAGIDSINEKLQKWPHLLDETAKALKALGIISKQEATRQAQEQIQNFEIAKQAFNKGLVSAEQLQQAIGKVQKSVQVSGNASQQAWLKSQQAALGLTQTLKTTQHAIENTAQSSRQIGTNMEQSANRGIKALDKLNQKLSETVTWNEKVAASASANQAKRQTKNNDFLAAVGRQHSQYSTLTGMENFLKSAGLSQEKAFEEARKLMESHGKNGRMNWASAMGHTEGMPITSMKSPSVYLLELAEKQRIQQAQQKRRDEFLKPKKNHAEQSHSSELDRLKRENEQLKLKHEKTKHALHSKRMENLSGGSAPSLQEIIQALDARTIQSIKQHAKTELLNELITEVKRMPR